VGIQYQIRWGLCFSLRPLKCGVVSIGYSLKSTSLNEQASHVFHGPRLASGTFLRLGKTGEHFLRGFGAENKLPGQFALLDLSILNFSIVLGKRGGPSCNRPAKHRSRSHDAVIRVYDDSGNVIETHEHNGNFKEP
jgi:hypothetical protein